MDRITFTNARTGASHQLRPTHAMKVAEELGRPLDDAGGRSTVRAGSLADACGRVRDGYRCRDVRKELRRVALLAVDAVAGRDEVVVTCDDPGVIAGMTAASRRVADARPSA